MLLYLLLTWAFSLVFPVLNKELPANFRWLLALWPLAGFVLFTVLPEQSFQVAWIADMGFHFSLKLDGLSRLFALLITGIGTLVYAYSSYYLANHSGQSRFFGFMNLFMGAMLGLVLANDFLLLFICWEMTSISSFFLIAFNHEEEKARKSAFTALAVTGLGGLALLGAAMLLQHMTGSWGLSDVLAALPSADEPMVQWAIALLFLAAFTKSAQFPFHFWLPGAMAAPTPISTYLHSATMVKAGVYLLLRLAPALGGYPWWQPILMGFGGLTMAYAAFHALFRTDMKLILAYTTVSALGLLVFLIGFGTPEALQTALVFIVVHALYKASLFLITGGVDHAVHTRNLLRLGGLYKSMPALAMAGVLAALLNGGFPPLLGFIGKDLMYELLWHQENGLVGMLLLVTTNIMLLYAGFQVGIRPFIGPARDSRDVVRVSAWIWGPPLILTVLGLLFGLKPDLIQPLIDSALQATGGQPATKLALWHGFNDILAWSMVTLLLGALLYLGWKVEVGRGDWLAKWEAVAPARLLQNVWGMVLRTAHGFTRFFQHGYLRYYVMSVVSVLTVGISYRMLNAVDMRLDVQPVLALTFYEMGTLVLLLGGLAFAVFSQSRLAAVAALGVMGLAICLVFVFYGAPDLAITQFTIDTLTVILFVLILYKLPQYIRVSSPLVVARDGFLSLLFGASITLLALLVLQVPPQKALAEFYASQSYLAAKGKNIVNVILVDFRGIDTLVEITVLSIAAIGVFGLLKLRLKSNERRNRV